MMDLKKEANVQPTGPASDALLCLLLGAWLDDPENDERGDEDRDDEPADRRTPASHRPFAALRRRELDADRDQRAKAS